jgi:outer membrane protein assembly factor BamA
MLRYLWLMLAAVGLLWSTSAFAQNPFLDKHGERTVRSISITGNERTKLYVLERELGFGVGDPYDSGAVADAWARLEELPYIAYVEIETARPAPGQVELEIRVVEEPVFWWRIGLEYSRRYDSAWYGDLRMGALDGLGRGDSLELRLDAWALRQARLRWTNPWILGRARLGVYADVGIRDHDWVYEPVPDARNTEFAVEAGIRREFEPGFFGQLAARWRWIQLSNLPDAGDPGGSILPTGDSVDLQEPGGILTFGFDNRDSRYYPNRGLDARASFAFGAPDAYDDYWSTFDLTLKGFVPIPLIHTLGGMVTRRWASEPLPWYERTYYGGPEDLRGVPFGSDRGDERLRASIEIRRPLLIVPLRGGRSIGLGLHAFHDWGTAWAYDESLSDQKLDGSYGLGAHFNFNTYNYRFEWARFDGENFFIFEDHFTF